MEQNVYSYMLYGIMQFIKQWNMHGAVVYRYMFYREITTCTV